MPTDFSPYGVEVELNRDLLVDLGGWAVLKEARSLVEAGRVKTVSWSGKVISGEVAGAGSSFFPRLNLRSLTFAENQCNCVTGRRGNVCAHAIALCLVEMNVGLPEESATITESIEEAKSSNNELASDGNTTPATKIQSLVISNSKGIPCRFIILLPPNLSTAAPKDKISVRVEFQYASGKAELLQNIDRGKAFNLGFEDQMLGGLIESFCGGRLHSMLQLTRTQLGKILECVANRDSVRWIKAPSEPILWKNGVLPGVHEHLKIVSTDEKTAEITPTQAVGEISKAPQTGSRYEARFTTVSKHVKVDGSPNYLSIELPPASDPSYLEILGILKQFRFKLEPGNGKWWLRDGHHVLNFLADYWDVFRNRYQAEFSRNFQERMAAVEPVSIKADIIPIGDRYELQIGISNHLSSGEMQEQIAKGKRYFQTSDKTYLIKQEQITKLDQLACKLTGSVRGAAIGGGLTLKGSTRDLCDWEDLLNEGGVHWVAPEIWKSRSEAVRNLSKLVEAPVESKLYDKLRLYQKIGVAWMYHLFNNDLSGILADEMGLGKTVQAIALITAIQTRFSTPALVVCPAGLVGNWVRELRQFAPQLVVHAHHGNRRGKSAEHWECDLDVVVSSYSTLARDIDLFHESDWSIILGDEAQHIKNRRTQHAKSLKQLQSKGRFLLTGTPIENNIEDLFSLFEFLMPGYLKKPPADVNKAEDRQWYQDRIRERAAHYILRRTKKQVAPELPEKLEQVIYCDMDDRQRELYEQFRRNSSQTIEKLQHSGASEGAIKMAAFTELLRLRQICADPRLLDPNLNSGQSCKWGVFSELLQESIDGGHRILVFSQFVSLLKLLQQELDAMGISYCYIDGNTRDRLKEADRFNQNAEIPVFLISLKAGGVGLNLTGADTVVHFDPWWNPAVEAQATDRAHRIGQTRKVTSIRLIVSGTVEEKVQLMQMKKRKLLESLFDESADQIGKLELSDIQELLSVEA